MMCFQVKNGKLREYINRLYTEYSALQVQVKNYTTPSSVQSGSSSARPHPPGWSREWNDFSRQYLLLIAPWPSNSAFGMMARPSIDPNSPARYASEQACRAAEAAEMYDLVPRKYHTIISRADSGFAATVCP